MSIPLHISPKIIPSIASLYNDTNRIFMEYIDNALDSAEEFFDEKNNSYKRKIKINLQINGSTYKDGVVIITDNCTGILNFAKVVQSIGDSDKRGQFTTNGQFGYGIYSFMAACETLEITSKIQKSQALFLTIKRSQFNKSKQEDVKFNDPKIVSYEGDTGTIIRLSGFDKDMWKTIDLDFIKNEIDEHFELILKRENLEVSIINNNKISRICEPFDYNKIEGDIWEDQFDILDTLKGRKFPQPIQFQAENPIKIFLKITKGREVNKKPVFIIKGRRISEIKDVKSFKSNHKSDIWGHPNLTGYVDIGGFLEPTIARNDFKNTPRSKAVFARIIELEELILDFLKELNKKSDDQHYKELEDELNKALSNLAKIDHMNFRTEIISGNKKPQNFDDSKGYSNMEYGEEINKAKAIYPNGDGEIKNPSEEPRTILDDNGELDKKTDSNSQEHNKISKNEDNIDSPFDDDEGFADERRKSGFNIKIYDQDPPIGEDNEVKRSTLVGGTIIIYRRHPDFEKRVDKKRTGDSIISHRLVTYLAGEITVHYKHKLVTREGQPDYNDKMFSSIVDFIYQFEEKLSNIVGKNLSLFNESANS